MDNKQIRKRYLSLFLALLMIIGSLPINIFAEGEGATSTLPVNKVKRINWNEKSDDTSDNWKLNQYYNIEPVQSLVTVSSSDPIDNWGLNYEGYFINADGRTVLRLVYNESSRLTSGYWHDLILKFDNKIYSKIDFTESFMEYFDGKRTTFSVSNGKNEKFIKIRDVINNNRSGWKHNVPIDLVLNEGVTYDSIKSDCLVQARLVNADHNLVYTFAPRQSGKMIDYTSYTKATVIPAANGIDNAFMRGPKRSTVIAGQRSFMTDYDNNPATINGIPNTDKSLAVLKTQYQWEHKSLGGANKIDGVPFGYMIAFDASLVDYFKEDKAGNIGYTTLQDANKVERKSNAFTTYIKYGIKKGEHINYTSDGKVAYIIFGEENFVKARKDLKVVKVGKLDGSLYDFTDNFTNIDFIVDKNKFINTFQTNPNVDQLRYSVMAGWVEPNTKGMTIFEKTFNNDVVIPAGGHLQIDTNGAPEGGQIMVQVGDDDNFIKRTQPYYNAVRNVDILTGFDQIEEVAKGIYKVPYRTGITIKKDQPLRVYLPDTADNENVSIYSLNNATEWNKGGVDLRFDYQKYNGEVNVHIGSVPERVELEYTLKGQATPKKTNIYRKAGRWQDDAGDELVAINRAISPLGGDFVLRKSMLEPGTDIIARAYSRSSVVSESSIKFNMFTKSDNRYKGVVIADNTDALSSIVIDKSTMLPYQQVFTNEYSTGAEDIYKNPTMKPTGADSFMTKTTQFIGFASYEGAPVRFRFYPNTEEVYRGQTYADENDRDEDGFITKDNRTEVEVDGKTYKKFKYTQNIADLVDITDETTKITNKDLKKDMRVLVNNSDGSSIPSNWFETRVRTRVLFDANKDFNWTVEATSVDSTVKIVPDSDKFVDEEGYKANGFSTNSGAILKDAGGNDLTGTDLEIRKWPANPKPFKSTKDGKTYKFLGWSTKQVTPEEFAKADKLTQLDQWKDTTKAYKVTEDSPIDSHKIVYGVWDEGLKIRLHSNNVTAGSNEEETVYEITVLQSDFVSGKATIQIPAVPYWTGDTTTTADQTLQKFVKSTDTDPRQTFIGWSADKTGDALKDNIGKNLSVLKDDGKISQDEFDSKAYNLGTILKEETTGTGEDQVITRMPTDVMLPNEYKLVLPGTYEQWLEKDHIDLYAQYRPFFNVSVTKNYKLIEGESTKTPSYVDSLTDPVTGEEKSINYKPNVKVGLLFRTAVTNFKDPTVHRAANYYNIKEGEYALTDKNIKGFELQTVSSKGKVDFTVPGYDKLGQRLSYSAVETKIGEESKYYDFKNDWASLGITIYTRIPGQGQDAKNEGPIDPADNNRREAKIQSITIPDTDPKSIDTFTSATTRNSIPTSKTSGEFDLKGYDITMYNVPREVPTPIFETVYDGDTSFKLKAEGLGLAVVDSVELKLPGSDEFVRFKYYDNDSAWKQVKPNPDAGASEKWIPEDDENIVGSITVEGTGAEKKLKFTRKTGAPAFKESEKIYAKYWKATLNGTEGETTVLALPTNIPVQKVVQEKNKYNDATDSKHEKPQVVISSEIPAGTGGVLYEPPADTTYVLVKADGTEILDEKNQPVTYKKTAGQQQGTKITFPAFDPAQNGLKHKDKVYIKTTLPDKDGRAFTPVTSTASAELIIQGPIKDIKYQDDYYRRWLDVTVDMKDGNYPVVGNFTITIDFKDGSTAKTINNITSMEKVQEILRELYRDDNIKKITVAGEDKFGNKSTSDVEYKEPKQIEVKFIMPRANDKQIKVSGPVGAEVTVTINPGTNQKVYNINSLEAGLNTIQLSTPIKRKDRISIYGEQKESDKIVGKTNPMTFTVRR